ncbi:MAG: sulfatase-like hydrolase/transferase [Bacteroidales bacterium]|jgi:arylsulfatase A-like enzyme|nr:sulfatase-like hydrolase/transferase [Bacteroidales bacterium]
MRISLFLFFILFAGVILPSCTTQNDIDRITNVVVIIGDDHASSAVGCYGNDLIRTPNIDRLAASGLWFLNAYSNAPVCSASRQSIITGKYPHATGVSLLRTPFLDEGNLTIAEYLRGRGYATGVVGKTHFNNYKAPVPDHGFSSTVTASDYRKWFAQQDMPEIPDSVQVLPKWKPFVDSARIWLNADVLPSPFYEGYGDADFDAMKAIEFLQENKDTTFFLWVGFHEPHSPFNFPIEYINSYTPNEIRVPEGSDEDDRYVPEIFRSLSKEDKQGIIAAYYTSAEYMDKNVGKILDAIEALNIEENTLVVYLGDQGYLLGDHKRFEKHTMWDPAIKAPLIFRVGGSKNKGKRSKALVQFIDIVPTILDLIDQPQMPDVQGKSMMHLYNSRASEGNNYVFAEFLEDNKAMVTDGKWKYIFTRGLYDLGQGYETGEGPSGILHKLYDIQNDPYETTDVAKFPGNETILKSLQEQMLTIFMETHPFADELSDTLSVEEKLIWFCEPYDVGANRGNH